MRIRSFIFWLITGLALTGVAAAAEPAEIPHPDADALQSEQMRIIVGDARELFTEQLAEAADDAARADAYGRLAMVYQALSFEDAAQVGYENALNLNPGDPRWHHFLAFLYQERGERARAVQSYQRVLELEPGYLPARIRLGLLLYDSGRKDEAEAELLVVLAEQPGNAPAIASMGRIAMDAGRTRAAIERFEQTLQLDAQANQVHYLLGLAYRQIGDTDQARTHLDQAGDRIPRIEDPWLITMQIHAQAAEYYLAQGLHAVQSGKMREAYNVFQLAALVDPRDPRAYLSLARVSQALGNMEAAGGFLTQALALAPEDANALFNAGLLSDQVGKTEQAIDYYRQALEKTPGFSEALVYLGNALMRQGKPGEAIDLYARASVLHESTESVLHLQALAYLATGQCAQAIPVLEQALAIDPNRGDIIQTQSRTFATCPTASDEQKQIGLADARELYALRPNLEHAETLAMAEAAQGNYQDAADYQAQAMFESFKAGGPDKFPGLTENMERYRDEQPPLRAWPPEHPVFSPAPPNLVNPDGDAPADGE